MKNSFDVKLSENYLKHDDYRINIKLKSRNVNLKTILINNIMMYDGSENRKKIEKIIYR